MRVHLRYFAAAAEAAGREAESIDVDRGVTTAALVAQLGDRHGPELLRVLKISSLLVDGESRGVSHDAEVPLRGTEDHDGGAAGHADDEPAAIRIDVLPPFAGG